MLNLASMLPEGYSIRQALFTDAEAIAHVHYVSFKTTYEGIIDQRYLNSMDYKERFVFRQKILGANEGIHLVALFRDTIVGLCDAERFHLHDNQVFTEKQKLQRTEKGEIYTLYLLEEHQRKGLGSALFQEARLCLQQRNLVPYLAWALKGNTAAHLFYEKQGGILVDEISVKIGDHIYKEIAYFFDG